MSTKSIFKFRINNDSETKTLVNTLIGNYLSNNEFNYNKEHQCYVIGTPSEEEANMNMAVNVAHTLESNLLNTKPSPLSFYTNIHQCLEYEIIENELIIKAYILNAFSNSKSYIHSNINSNMAAKEFYRYLQKGLFSELEKNNIKLASVETEKVSDGSGKKLFKKTLFIVFPIIVIFTVITLVAYFSSH